ncbi:MAG: ABC transporter permease [Halobacteriaceae archaeon]
MTFHVVAKKDFKDAIRSKTLWGLTAIFILFTGGLAYIYTIIQGESGLFGGLNFIFFLIGPVTLLVPIIALILGHQSIAGEIESNSIKTLLSLPHTRRDVIIGKILGRGTVLGVSILSGFIIATIIVVLFFASFSVLPFVIFTIATLLFGYTYVSIGVSLSSLTKSTTRATVLAASFYIIFEIIWQFVPLGVYYIVKGEIAFRPPSSGWYYFLAQIRPSSAYGNLLRGFLPEATIGLQGVFPNGIPFYLSKWANLVILLGWLLIPAALGYYRFSRTDL